MTAEPLKEYVLVITGAKTEEADLDGLHRQLNRLGFDVMEKTDTERNLSGKLHDEVIGVVLMDSPKVSTRALRINNCLVPIVVLGGYRSDPPGDVCCTMSSTLAARYLKSECALRHILAHRADSLFEEEAVATAA